MIGIVSGVAWIIDGIITCLGLFLVHECFFVIFS